MRTLTHPDGTPVTLAEMAESTPISLVEAPKSPSQTFVVSLSIIFGLIIGLGTILGVLGKAFYVPRDEYTLKNMVVDEETIKLKATLERLDNSMSRQEAAFDKLSDVVQDIKMNLARHPR